MLDTYTNPSVCLLRYNFRPKFRSMGQMPIAHLDSTERIILEMVWKAGGVELKEFKGEPQTREPTKERSKHSANVKEKLAVYIRSCRPC
jgi:hypothetical protein